MQASRPPPSLFLPPSLPFPFSFFTVDPKKSVPFRIFFLAVVPFSNLFLFRLTSPKYASPYCGPSVPFTKWCPTFFSPQPVAPHPFLPQNNWLCRKFPFLLPLPLSLRFKLPVLGNIPYRTVFPSYLLNSPPLPHVPSFILTYPLCSYHLSHKPPKLRYNLFVISTHSALNVR